MLFSFLMLLVNCFMHANQTSVLIHAALSKSSSCCFGRKHFRLKWVDLFIALSAHALHCVLIVAYHIFIRVDAASEAVHELVAEPVQEPRAEEQ